MRWATLSALPQEELDAVARRLLGHEFRLLAVLGIDDLVLAVLVAIRARQIALVRDVHHHRGERDDPGPRGARRVHHRHHRQHPREAGLGLVLVADRASLQQVGDGIPDGRRSNRSASAAITASSGCFCSREQAQHRRRRLVEREDRGARDQVQEIPPRSLEQMELARR